MRKTANYTVGLTSLEATLRPECAKYVFYNL